jgi:tetratricopeptide (TPR) repeat protein
MIRVWDLETGETIRLHRGHSGTVRNLSLSPDGNRLASCGDDQTVRIWDVATGQEVQNLKPSARIVLCVAFSPDGMRLLASGSARNSLTVWDARPLTDELRLELVAVNQVESLFAEHVHKKNAVHALQTDPVISDALRKRSLELAEQRHVNPNDLNDRSWSLAKLPGSPGDQYQSAIRYAEAACELSPENGMFLNTLGVARYRAGKYAEAVETLTRADALNARAFGGSLPADVAFLAMAHHQLGHVEQAGKFLEQLRQAIETDRWKADAESQAFFKEAVDLISPPNDAPVKAQPPTKP